jgi:hypothetical protein
MATLTNTVDYVQEPPHPTHYPSGKDTAAYDVCLWTTQQPYYTGPWRPCLLPLEGALPSKLSGFVGSYETGTP